MTAAEALMFFEEHEKWLSEKWSMSPDGRDYAKEFHAAIEALKLVYESAQRKS